MNDAALIPLRYRGRVANYAVVDKDLEDWLNEWRWVTTQVSRVGEEWGYATRSAGGRPWAMHRQILGLGRGDKRIVHHANQVKFDNRRANLVICNGWMEHHSFNHQQTTEADRVRLGAALISSVRERARDEVRP